MRRFKKYDMFLESSIEKTFSIDKFIEDVKDEMHWNSFGNGVSVSVIEPDKRLIEKDKTPKEIFPKCNIFFIYTGAPGQSVRKDILKACEKHGYITAKVSVVSNYERHADHHYLIGLSVSPTVAASYKYGI